MNHCTRFFLLLVLLMTSVIATAQTTNIPVMISDKEGKPVAGLRAEDFQLLDENKPQQITGVQSPDDPVTVVLLLDVRDTTGIAVGEIRKQALKFLEQLRVNERLMVATFDNQGMVMNKPDETREKVRELLQELKAGGGTRLYDTLGYVLKQRLSQIPGRKALVLFTDSLDVGSVTTSADVLKIAEESDVIVFPIECRFAVEMANRMNVSPVDRNRDAPPPAGNVIATGYRGDYEKSNTVMRGLSGRTGGRFQIAENARMLERAFSQLLTDLRGQYNLSFAPSPAPKPGQKRKLKISVNKPDLSVHVRGNYVYPGSTK